MTERLLTLDAFDRMHRQYDQRIKRYLHSGHGHHLANEQLLERLCNRSARRMLAINARSRIVFVRPLRDAFDALFLPEKTVFGFVTFAPWNAAVSLSKGARFPHRALIRRFLEQFGDFNAVGMVDVALYTNLESSGTSGEAVASWHIHALIFGTSHREMLKVRDEYNCEVPGSAGGDAIHVRQLRGAGGAKSRLIYQSKMPMREMRIIRRAHEVYDPETGEILRLPYTASSTKKRPLRPGDGVRVFEMMGHRTIPDLAFGNGLGDEVLQTALERARKRILREDRQHVRRLEQLIGHR
ncbi:hypothetical protein [Pararhizobium mangrovi]|uniref:Replication protein n=1 Tax=Pararhizobium mangrovi TaxID=2590452 RepID=A0A506U083_9HYPH|nr:hypothetical protein [Pararhizobium mangrovi]TPW25999.1 hypothetical protein FJU11_16820 [Pararhizobium mangrovi]